MELGIVPTLAYLGSNIDVSNENEDIDYKYEKVNFIYNNDSNDRINEILNEKNDLISKSEEPQNTNIINNRIKSINKIFPINKDMSFKFYEDNVSNLDNSNLFESFDNNLQSNDLNFEDQFKPLTYDSNIKDPQSSNSHNSVSRSKFTSLEREIALGNDYTLFDKEENDMTYGIVNKDEFTHSNMVPHFSQKGMINDYNYENYSHKAELFSGSSKEYVPKNELLKENFSPLQRDVNLVNGSRNNLSIMQPYYIPGREKRNQLPFEQTKVGPGLNLAPEQTTRADGSRQEDYRPLPKTSDQMRSADRPKVSYTSILKTGQKGSKLGVIGDVFKRRPEKTVEINPDNMQKSGGEFKKQVARNKINLRKTERKNSKLMIGPAKSNEERDTTKNTSHVSEPFKTEDFSKEPSNMQGIVKKHNPNKCSFKLPENSRSNKLNGDHIAHPNKMSLGNVKFDPHDLPKETLRETMSNYSQSGHVKGVEGQTVSFNPNDMMKETLRETGNVEQGGYAKGIENNITSYNPKDISRQTTKQTTIYNEQSGYAKGVENKNQSFDPNNLPRQTTKQTTTFTEQGGYAKGIENKNPSFDPNDLTKVTRRELTSFSEQAGYAKGIENKNQAYDPTDLLDETLRGMENFQGGYAKGIENKNKAYDPTDLLDETLRGMENFQGGYAKGLENKNPAYDPNDILDETLRGNENYQAGHAKSLENKNHVYNPNDILDETMRGTNSNYYGHATELNQSKKYYDPTDLSRATLKQETIFTEREGHMLADDKRPIAFNPNDIPATTLKDLLIEKFEMGVAKGEINKSKTFNPKDVPAETLKELLVQSGYISNVNKDDSLGGYLSNKQYAPETLRQLSQILRFSGAGGDNAPKDYSAEKNMELDDRREILNKSRKPTNRNFDKTPTSDINLGDLKLKENINIERIPLINRQNYHSNNFNLPSVYLQNDDRNVESNRLNPEILHQLNNNPLVNNPVISFPDDMYDDC